MKQSQWVLTGVVLAAMVFAVTFAMNYLGGGGLGGGSDRSKTASGRELTFSREQKVFPSDGSAVDAEEKAPGHHDFWFVNTNDQPVKVGIQRMSCKCSAVEVHVLGDDSRPRLLGDAAALSGVAPAGPLAAVTLQALGWAAVQRGTQAEEVLKHREFATVPPGAVGWVRLKWSGERTQGLQATLWFDDPDTGRTSNLEVRLRLHEAMRVLPALRMGTITDAQLSQEQGVTEHIICWSSTRPTFRLEARAVGGRLSSGADGFEVGTPQPLDRDERLALEKESQSARGERVPRTEGPVMSAYRVPVTVRHGKTPFDIGPFRRRVELTSPDVEGDAKSVEVTGQVRGVVEVGHTDDEGEVKFGTFRRQAGKTRTVALASDVAGLELRFDRARTPEFLTADPGKPSQGERRRWTLTVRVLPDKAGGEFGDRTGPRSEDSAVYLIAEAPGGVRRSVRIPVSGTATQ